MQVDSSAPFTSVAQAMGQTAQPATPVSSDSDGDSDGSPPASAANPPGVGSVVDLTA